MTKVKYDQDISYYLTKKIPIPKFVTERKTFKSDLDFDDMSLGNLISYAQGKDLSNVFIEKKVDYGYYEDINVTFDLYENVVRPMTEKEIKEIQKRNEQIEKENQKTISRIERLRLKQK